MQIPKTEAKDGKVLLHILLRPINPIDHITLQGAVQEDSISPKTVLSCGSSMSKT